MGIEIVGEYSAKSQSYATVNKEQNSALAWLVNALETRLALDADDVYTHGSIGYKQLSEGSTANWTRQ